MAKKFKEQGGAATMDPNDALRWATSKLMTGLSGAARLQKKRQKIEKERAKSGQPHIVEYFHQVADGYSHLAAQVLQQFAKRYNVQLKCHLVSGPTGSNSAEPELLLRLSRYDSFHVAPEYGLQFPQHDAELNSQQLHLAKRVLAGLGSEDFVANAALVGNALWNKDEPELNRLAQKFGSASDADVEARIDQGNLRRDELNHYSGAMLYYGEEWYWGVDRLYHLEQRLAELGADHNKGQPLIVPRPELESGDDKDNGSLTLEVYPSLRSPYTAMSFDRAVKLAQDTGVKLVVKPVLPMVMRGVPATRQKGMYIFMDAAREARAAGVEYGKFYDPIGEPVRRAYSIYPWACEQGKGNEFLSAFLSAAFARGVNTNTNKGLRKVVEQAGLSWKGAQEQLGSTAWIDLLEQNRQAMYEAGLWGVPSFRLLNKSGEQILALWGQDRLWLFAREIKRQLALR